MGRNKVFLCGMNEIQKRNFVAEQRIQKQNDKQNKRHNHDADALFHHLDHCNHDGIVFLKAVLRYAHNCVSTETISRTILLQQKINLI